MKQLIQLRGCMGTGKTSTARSVLQRGNYRVCTIKVGKTEYPYCYDEKKRWAVTGRYDLRNCGGLDGIITNKDVMKYYLYKIMKDVTPEVIVFEAVMYGLTYKFGEELNRICTANGYKYTGILLKPQFEIILENIAARNGGKPINIEMLSEKYFRSETAAEKLNSSGVKIVVENPMDYAKEDMYKIVEKQIL